MLGFRSEHDLCTIVVQAHIIDQEIIMTSIQLNQELPAELFSNILITAFDGSYGESLRTWAQPAPPKDGHWLETTGEDTGDLWKSARVRVREDWETGNPLFDSPEGFVIDHASLAGGLSRILNGDYLNARPGETASGLRSHILKEVMGEDPSSADLDAFDCDAIVQCAAFGKVIFG